MELTGRCKEDFEKWFLKGVTEEEGYNHYILRSFNSKGDSMKYGVYEDFFDSIGLEIYVAPLKFPLTNNFYYSVKGKIYYTKTRPESRTKVIEGANELYNNN